jgi:diguanylate cyclase (GGDEF)-like protein
MCEHCRLDYYLHSVFEHELNNSSFRYRFSADGRIREKYLNLSGRSLVYQGKQYASISLMDITYNMQKEKNLRRQLEYDFSTGAKNRRALVNATRNLLMENLYFSIVMLDFDYFKIINDTSGHVKGDNVLAQFSKIVYKNIRRGDFFARYGGEEFILLFKRTKTDEAIEIIERIQNELKSFFDGRIQHPVTFSAGLLYLDLRKEKVKDVTELFSRVDKLLYDAKNSGRNKIVTNQGERCFK